jgi:serine O-acetyltransferase
MRHPSPHPPVRRPDVTVPADLVSEIARDRVDRHPLPLKRDVAAFVDDLLGLLFPQLAEGGTEPGEAAIAAAFGRALDRLGELLHPFIHDDEAAGAVVRGFAAGLPDLRRRILEDAEAILAGDPAAESLDEVVAAYPGFLAIAVHRIAHRLTLDGVPVLPRLLAEVAHTRTGVDIHPGATIGPSFCIDHGTGIVIGETAVIGRHVKLYQGVTLGALSVAKSAAGTKRHPTIGDRVVIYANATVLGGETVIGADSVVGGNAFLTSSIPPSSVVTAGGQVRTRRAGEAAELDFVI